METDGQIQIIAFYEFKDLGALEDLSGIKERLKRLLRESDVRGTIILATEGFNGMACGEPEQISKFVERAAKVLDTNLSIKSSFFSKAPFRKIDVKIKPEIVTLKKPVDVSLGRGTHVNANDWNRLISDPDTFVLDTRNDYEYKTGTFKGAVNPQTKKFSELPEFVANNLDPTKHKRVAMFCTGGIRCEKFAPYLKQMGFKEVFQLEGGILKYLEQVPSDEMLWEGECFVFDERVTVDQSLNKGAAPDHSQRHAHAKKPTREIKE
jgi:UPF0176 protein